MRYIHNYIDWYKRGVDACDANNFTFAVDALCKAIELDPDNVAAFHMRAFAYKELGNNRKAIEDYNILIDHFPLHAQFYFRRGIAYDKLGEHLSAVNDYSNAIHLRPTYVDAYYNRAIIYAQLYQYDSSIDDFNRVIGLKPNFADAYNYRGHTYFLMGNNDLGYKDALKASKLGNNQLLEWIIKYGVRPSKQS